MLSDSLNAIEQNGPGISPQNVWDKCEGIYYEQAHDYHGYTLNLENGLYSGTFDKRLYAIYVDAPQYLGEELRNGVNVSTGIVEKYVSKFHGKTIVEDFELAGFKYLIYCTRYSEGFIFNISDKGKDKVKYDHVLWDGQLVKDVVEKNEYGQHAKSCCELR